jgi:hypothetical protein
MFILVLITYCLQRINFFKQNILVINKTATKQQSSNKKNGKNIGLSLRRQQIVRAGAIPASPANSINMG